MAHALLACKNVTVEDHQPSPKLSKRHQRDKGRPLVTFKTLRVTPMGARRADEGGRGDEIDRALHIVRGHFKTFTTERPLFGRLTGTYWWRGARGPSVCPGDWTSHSGGSRQPHPHRPL